MMIDKEYSGPYLLSGRLYLSCDGCGNEGFHHLARKRRWWPWSKWRVQCESCGDTYEIPLSDLGAILEFSDSLTTLRGLEMMEKQGTDAELDDD